MKTHSETLTVYYDHSCPICREEIAALKSVDRRNRLSLIDCSSEHFDDANAVDAGLTQEDLKNALHVRDSEGQWHVAADAFVVMYDAVGFESAARLLRRPGVRRVFDRLYPVFVRHRHKLRFTGAHKLMPWLIRRSARRQAAKAASCANQTRPDADRQTT